MKKLLFVLLGCLAVSACADDGQSVVDATAELIDAQSDASPIDALGGCDVFSQDCPAPQGCLWTQDETSGMCRELGGIEGIGRRMVGDTCQNHAQCEPGLGCFNVGNNGDAGIIFGECRPLCEISAPSCPGQCTSIPGMTLVGYCP